MEMKGFKVFNKSIKTYDSDDCPYCFEVGNVYELNVSPAIFESGFHFYECANDLIADHDFAHGDKIVVILAIGDTNTDGIYFCSNKIKIVKEVTLGELIQIAKAEKNGFDYSNSGDNNYGKLNTGRGNFGDCNSGSFNDGRKNSGNNNIGSGNKGNFNVGNRNFGSNNVGCENIGSNNIGVSNFGHFNKSDFQRGCFCTETPAFKLFNKPTKWTFQTFYLSKAYSLLNNMPKNVIKVNFANMTAKEKEDFPEAEITGVYLKRLNQNELIVLRQKWWESLSERNKNHIKNLPNFDPAIFKEITGIDVESNG